MKRFRQTDYPLTLLLGLLIIFSLLCSQGVVLHVHDIDEAHGSELAGQLHSAYDLSHSDHHDGPVYEQDGSPDGTLKKASPSLLVLALFALSLMLLVPPLGGGAMSRRERKALFPPERHLFSPPLRAPPL